MKWNSRAMSKDYCEESVKDSIKQYIMFYRVFFTY